EFRRVLFRSGGGGRPWPGKRRPSSRAVGYERKIGFRSTFSAPPAGCAVAGPCAVLRLSGLPCGEPVEDPPAGRTFGDWLIFRPWPVKFALLAGRWRAPKIGFSFNGVPLDCVLSNGVSLNGVSLNGVALNRVSPNGISLNGVTGYESP